MECEAKKLCPINILIKSGLGTHSSRLRLSIKTSIVEKAVKVKDFNLVIDYKFIFTIV